MSLAAFDQGDRSARAGAFGEQWFHAVAAGCGHLHGPPHGTQDRIKADVLLTFEGELGGWYNPSVLVQVKTTTNLREHDADHWAYDIDTKTHEVLSRTNERTRRILAVIGLSEEGETLRTYPDGTLLVGRTSWVSLEGEPKSTNSTSQVVYLPRSNVLDPEGLKEMLSTYGVPRSSMVPAVEEWGDAS